MSKHLVIDGDNMLYRAYFKFGQFTSKTGEPSGIIFGLPYMLRGLLTKVKPFMVTVAFDGGRDKARTDILPGYKIREPKLGFDKEAFMEQKMVIMGLLQNMNCMVVHKLGTEADDHIYTLARHDTLNDIETVIVSADKDFHQMISEMVTVWYPNKDIMLTHKNLHRYFPYTPTEALQYLCLTGDDSDKIPGVPGIGEKRARQFMDGTYNYPNMKVLQETVKRNRKLIDLRHHWIFHNRGTKVPYLNEKPRFNMIEIAKVARRYDCTTLTRVDFITGFKDLI